MGWRSKLGNASAVGGDDVEINERKDVGEGGMNEEDEWDCLSEVRVRTASWRAASWL